MRSLPRIPLVLVCVFSSVAGCALGAEEDEDIDDFHGMMDEMNADEIGTGLVRNHVASGCSTAVVTPLARQIAEEMLCMSPGVLARLDEGGGISFRSSAVLPYMEDSAAEDLRRAASEAPLTLNSGFRAVVQQFLLREWYERGRCGIRAAARPGRSNHETGRAIDVSATSAQKAALRRNGWTDPLANDPVHFEHRSSPDLRGMDVHAFQRLWNRNHPQALIDEDGQWGPMTRSAMLDSPAGGFREGPTCEPGSPEDELPPDEEGPMCTAGTVVGACCEVDGQDGICIDTNTTSCGGEIHIGYCPGGNNVRCCTQ